MVSIRNASNCISFNENYHPEKTFQDVEYRPEKRRKTTGGLRVGTGSSVDSSEVRSANETLSPMDSTTRQLKTKSREFPQRKKKEEAGVHPLLPSSTEKFVTGVWKQIYSSVKITPASLVDFLTYGAFFMLRYATRTIYVTKVLYTILPAPRSVVGKSRSCLSDDSVDISSYQHSLPECHKDE